MQGTGKTARAREKYKAVDLVTEIPDASAYTSRRDWQAKIADNFDAVQRRIEDARKLSVPTTQGSAHKSTMRTFLLIRVDDVSGTSGTGPVAEGIEWSNGTCTVHWLSQLESYETCANMKVLEQIHGHGGRTRVEFTP